MSTTLDTSGMKDIDSLRNTVGVIPSPFASAPFATEEIADDDSSDSDIDVNFRTGFPSTYEVPIIDPDTGAVNKNARVITRTQVNTLGNIGTQTQFFEQCGGYYTFDPKICSKIKGYPAGAILRFYDEDTNTLRTVKSLRENNDDNFIEDRSFIGSNIYTYVTGQHISWVYIDDIPEVGIIVDYSEFIDISDKVFTSTGVPDLYEVPYDGYLQMWGLGWLSCNDFRREDVEDITLAKSIEIVEGVRQVEYATWNGMYFTYERGTSYLDIYTTDTSSCYSTIIGGFYPFEWVVNRATLTEGLRISHFSKICPLSPFSFGGFLRKGTKIKIRDEVTSVVSEAFSLTECSKISEKLYTDADIRRNYQAKYAKLFKVKWGV